MAKPIKYSILHYTEHKLQKLEKFYSCQCFVLEINFKISTYDIRKKNCLHFTYQEKSQLGLYLFNQVEPSKFP